LADSAAARLPLVLLGGGGHCKACVDVVEAAGRWEILGILDLPARVGERVLGYSIVGTDERVAEFAAVGASFLVSIGQIGTAALRRRAYERIRAAGAALATVVSPLAYVSPSAAVGPGSIVMHRAVVNAGATIGRNVIINTMALVEHDARVDDHCHVATAAVVNGAAAIGAGSFVGSNAVVVQGAVVPDDSFIAAGTLFRQPRT